MPEIYKIQRSLYTTMDDPQILVYNEDRSQEGQFSATEEVLKLFDEDEYKIFVLATLKPDGQIDVIEIVDDPGW